MFYLPPQPEEGEKAFTLALPSIGLKQMASNAKILIHPSLVEATIKSLNQVGIMVIDKKTVKLTLPDTPGSWMYAQVEQIELTIIEAKKIN